MERLCLKIRGIVQGVGFRPFVHKLVRRCGLSGYIKNTSSGVALELEGERPALERFVALLPEQAPMLAVIESMEASYSPELRGYEGFEIRQSQREEFRNTLISPDIGICEDCLRELRDPRDRRYRYPFINCTNCGPRFTIIKDIPYDRAKTSMAAFPMCQDCDREYHDIDNRRYHAQPDCCASCGPRVFYLDETGNELPGDGIELAREALKAGKIVAVKGLGGMHLACRCDDEALVRELRRRKQRDEKPFALMCRDVDCARRICRLSEAEEKVLTSFRRPIVLLEKRQPGLDYLSENGCLGVMLPYTPLHYLLFGDDLDMLVMTSANLSDTPILFKNAEALDKLRGIADGFLLHDREIQTRCDDSLCWVLEGKEYPARRSRGYVPFPLRMEGTLQSVLACGAEQKASFCLSKGSYVFPSQHIGDLKNMETLENYTQQIAHFKHLFDIEPTLVTCDLHPDYMSTEYAQSLGLPLVQVQHHHAHLAACMADNGLAGEVIGLVWDGTGYGPDGTTWGGECLVGGYETFRRFGHILPLALPGGDRATKEIDRLAFSLLYAAGCDTSAIPGAETYRAMLAAGLNCPLSSGMGRLFDGVAAILGVKTRCSYEGQGAILLEAAARDNGGTYPILLSGRPLVFDWREMIRAIVQDRQRGVDTGVIAARFMNTLVEMAVKMAVAAREETGLNRVCLSGGSFQNMYIMHRLPDRLRDDGFQVYHHSRVSANDEGIALGQLMIANAKWKGKENVSCRTPEID
ncbi:MAG: carbamoyltransferase HypF [Oscillospiraceae bacterium]|nr:carbamoyltransferase HypF [Oscillospiraceae bacterium]